MTIEMISRSLSMKVIWQRLDLNLQLLHLQSDYIVATNCAMKSAVDPDETTSQEPSHLDLHCFKVSALVHWAEGI